MQHIYLIRHGQSVANAERIIAGQHETPLSDLGVQQAELAAKAVSDSTAVDLIVSSPMARARHTAEIIAEHIGYPREDIRIIPELMERGLGELEGKRYDDTPFGSGNVEDAEGATGIEPIEAFYERAKCALEKVYDLPGRHILVVCHNGTGRMLRTVAHAETAIAMYHQPRMENAVVYPLMD